MTPRQASIQGMTVSLAKAFLDEAEAIHQVRFLLVSTNGSSVKDFPKQR